jgi:urate oxidase / 2-oxo-4-hydroxy-4-carboxy-5-ureidoimidazoline decarboxylase
MEQFASGVKSSYYGKGDVIVYRLQRDGGHPAQSPVFGANVLMLLYGDAFWPTYTMGDNTGLIATDSMKNFIQRETLNFIGTGFEEYCRFLATAFLSRYPQTEGLQVSAVELPYDALGGGAYRPAGGPQAAARLELTHAGIVDVRSSLRGFRLLALGGSAFKGFVRDEYTTLPELNNRPLHMWLDVEWRYGAFDAAFTLGEIARAVEDVVHMTFQSLESGSIQQVIYRMGTAILAKVPEIAEVHLEAQNRTWDTVVEHGQVAGVYTDPRPPYGCLGLRLTR